MLLLLKIVLVVLGMNVGQLVVQIVALQFKQVHMYQRLKKLINKTEENEKTLQDIYKGNLLILIHEYDKTTSHMEIYFITTSHIH